MPTQPESPYYAAIHYDTKRRFISYWHQISETLELEPRTVLEVGKGSGFVQEYLEKLGIKVTTVDIDPDLHPDTVAGIVETPFQNKQFDVVSACEILEHLPYEESKKAFKEIARLTTHAIISLPDNTPWYKIDANLPIIGRIYYFFNKKKPIMRDFSNDSCGHFWEIGTNDTPLVRIEEDMREHFIILKSYRVREHPAHHFFVLKSR